MLFFLSNGIITARLRGEGKVKVDNIQYNMLKTRGGTDLNSVVGMEWREQVEEYNFFQIRGHNGREITQQGPGALPTGWQVKVEALACWQQADIIY